MEGKFNLEEFRAIVAALRSENGCPWDKIQTHESLKSNMVEEAYEVNQAITNLTETNDPTNLKEELGDVLLQVVLQSQIAEENGEFALEDVIDGIARKMIHRHPHVFGDKHYDSLEEQQADWDNIKAEEVGHEPKSPQEELGEVPAAFPALMRSEKVMKRAIKHEMVSKDDSQIFRDILSTLLELGRALSDSDQADSQKEKMGKLLLLITQLSAAHKLNAEMSLTREIEKFIRNH